MFYKGNEDREKRLRFSIRKVSFGAASVAVAALFMFPGNGTVSATEQGVTPTNEGRQGSPLKDPDVQNGTYGATPVVNQLDGNSGSSETTAPKGQEETSTTATPAPVVSSPASVTEEAEEKATPDLDKKQLEDYVAEIDAKLASGSYATKTDESVATLKEHLELAKLALTTAKSQDELTKAYRKLLMTASSGLRNKPKAQVESPKLDTTEGKATVGKKASTTDKATGTNSIANSGQHDPRNGQALDRNNPFRTDGTTTDTDPDANQTYTLPGDSANLKEVANSLINLPTKITNETKITSINEVGALQKIAPGEVKDINEFGGWKATSGGVFAIARRTDKGVFPIETVNTVLVQNGPYRTWLNESTFDRSKDYALFLAEVRTKATEEEAVDDGSVYVAERHYANKGIGLAKFKGIEKTFKAYSKSTGSDVIVSFKTGFTGDIDGKKAKYRVEVFAKDESGTTRTIYDQIFSPNENREDETKKVVAPIIGRDQYFDTNRASLPTRETLNEKLEQDPNKRRLGTSTGTFTSKGIVLEPNVTEYTVRISPGDNANLGMGYQVPWKQYALPISGLGFTLEQDTSRVAKALLQRVYNKLKETEEKDTKGKTEATINDYRTQLENVNKLLTGDLKKTQDYKDIVTTVLAAQQALRTDKSKLDTANTKLLNLINENPDPRIGKTLTSITSYDFAKTEAINAQTEAQKILNQDNPDPDVVATIASELNEKLAELKIARAELVDKATEEQKTKLEADAGKLTKASTEGKTQDSITAYNEKYAQLATELEAAKNKATAIKEAGDNASEHEALKAQAAVDGVLAKLEAAKAVLVDKATDDQVSELRKADVSLTPASASTFETAKTPASIAAYKKAVEAIQTDLTEAKATAADLVRKAEQNNATQADATSAIAKVDKLKVELAKANALLKDKANTSDLATAKDALKELAKVENATDGKTTSTAAAYTAAKQAADAAVAKAEGLMANPNVTPEEVAEALTEVKARKDELEKAKVALVDKATEEQKTKLEADAGKLTKASTEGKTQDSITAYNEKYAQLATELEAAKTEAEKVLAKENNATKEEVTAAQAKVDAVKAELDKAVELLKDLDREAAKKEIADAAKTATDAIEASTSFTPEQKAEEKVKVAKEATDATDAIDKATTEAELDKALRTFLYQMDQDSLVYERPSFDLEAFIQSSITGVVTVERGKAIHQADIIAKLNLPESITVISIDLPDTNTLGDKFAKVMLRLADGKEITVKVPVRVVASQSGESKPETSLPDYGRNNGSTNTDAKVDKAKLEGAIRQLDELIIQESAKLDAETAKEANALSADAKKVFANADTSQAEVDAMIKRIEDFMAKVALSTDHATPTNDQAAQTPAVAPTTTQAAVNAGHIASAQASVRTVAKELPNTGTVDSVVSMVVAAASALLGLGLAGRRRKEDEEA
ncbi:MULTISPECIES: YSIRK-type signal peptide-containing protein [unclassified Streptococcus]|uniref:YSIRK-type signal peptide-containing protein n=1 Tax=unclassified Streptococcus TaxID=2608887 RepID=UPI0020C8FD08|nr:MULTISPECIES: YSIRK-type signal peptide-containing protein [unclassified Streptococcus]MCP9061009.1 YSIRK-type signal peptide-containing protein [Streptococcus sp. CF7_Ac1-12]MCP9084364.1 YSIRK-type signal peptide-containing protein [Streptococcus sp. CF7_Ac1-8]